MNNDLIIIVVGETGSGKSWIMNHILSKYQNIKMVKKYTTRKSRIDERENSESQGNMSIQEIEQMKYTYVNPINKELYGIKFDDINNALNNNLIPCLEISNEDVYLSILNDFSDKRILLLKVVPYFDEESMKDTFEKQGRNPIEFEQRKSVLQNPLTDWVYDYKNIREIANPYFLRNCPPDVSNDVIVKRIENILKYELNIDLRESYIGNSNYMGLYRYLYVYSNNKPKDEKFDFKTNYKNK